jgi:para-aminobenzoate synthetase/4-amino-4-deoxychorismate lyase
LTPDSSRTPPLEPRIVRVPVALKLAPERAALLVRDDVRPFALIGRWAGGGALIGSDPVKIAAEGDDPFALLDEQLPLTEHAGAVGGGWFGWLGYELGQRVEPIGPSPPPARTDPPFRLAYYDHLLHLDPDGRWWFEALWTEPRARTLRMRVRAFEERAARAPKPQRFATTPWRATPGTSGHALAVGACRERIRAGDLFQANICIRLESQLSGAPIDLFARAVEGLRPDRAAFLSDSSGAVASLSPELFLERHGRRVRSAPIKGTRPRPGDPRRAARERAALEASEKDRAENVMIVDLVRNDLGRVCRPGSIHVDALAEARAHAGVWHLVSEVSGVVRDGLGDGSLVRAAFPPGSVSGAPKVAAMSVIAELESTGRQLYTGAIGFASPLAGLELSVAIRTFEFDGKRAWLGVGGGIVADSEPLAEAAECATKAAPLLAAIGATVAAADPAAPSHASSPPPPRRLGPRPVPRPDPVDGVFETLLVIDGRPVELERHLDRLSDSMRQLYRKALPGTLEQELRSAASGLDQARMRVDLRPGPCGGLRREIELTTVAGRPLPVRLIPVTVPGGLGCHKWSDRRLLAALASDGGAEPLLCDLDGAVLEAGRANLFVVEDGGRITTPPLDGRILPGVTRARVLELARALALNVRVEPVELARLAAADEIFVTGSLGGVEPATLAGGVGRARSDGEITSELARAWRAWSGVEPADRTALAG